MKRFITPMVILGLAALSNAQETKTVTILTKDGKTTVTVNGKEVKTVTAQQGMPLTIDVGRGENGPAKQVRMLIMGSDGKMKVVQSPGGPSQQVRTVQAGKGPYTTVSTPQIEKAIELKPSKGVASGPAHLSLAPTSEHQIVIREGDEIGEASELKPGQHPHILMAHPGMAGHNVIIREGIEDFRETIAMPSHGTSMQGSDDARIRELSRRIDELAKELAQLRRERGMASPPVQRFMSVPSPLTMPQAMSPKQLDEMIQREVELGKANKGFMYKFDDKAMGPKVFRFDGKDMKGFQEQLQKEIGKNPKIRFWTGGEGMEEGMEEGKEGKDEEKLERFFNEPFFQTPTPQKQSGKTSKKPQLFYRTQGGRMAPGEEKEIAKAMKEAEIAMRESTKERANAMIEAKKAIAEMRAHQGGKIPSDLEKEIARTMKETQAAAKEGSKERAQAIAEARNEIIAARAGRDEAAKDMLGAKAGASSSEISSLRKQIAALEAEMKALREENRKLREMRKTPPPPQVEVRSKRLR